MDNKVTKTLIFLVLILLALLFYWFEIRTANIKKSCSLYAIEKSVVAYPYNDVPDTTKRTELQEALEDKLYRNCLAENGL